MKKSIFILFVLICAGTFLIIDYLKSSQEKSIYEFNKQPLAVVSGTYRAIQDIYEIAAQKDFNSFMQNKVALEILHHFKESNSTEEQNILRGELYRALYKSYDTMKAMKVRQFHIHTCDGKSLLRMHLPYVNGDSLMELRSSIATVNKEHTKVFGFEGGRVYPGFRYVFPIIDGESYLGSVEFSISFDAFEEKLRKLLPENSYQLIMLQSTSYDKIFPSYQGLLVPSFIDSNYYVENPALSMVTAERIHNGSIHAIVQLAKDTKDFKKKMGQHKDFSQTLYDANTSYVISLIAIKDTENKHAGYIVSVGEQDEIMNIVKIYQHYKLLVLGGALLIFILIVIILKQIEKMRQHQKKLQSMNSSLLNAQAAAHFGSIEYDHRENKFYVSDEILNIFGLVDRNFVPSSEFFLSFVHPDDRRAVRRSYLESLHGKSEYSFSYRIIKVSGEVCFVEARGTHELDEQGGILKSFWTVYDVTRQVNAYKSLERFIDLQSSIVILTNGIDFQFANKSFYNFFGFENIETFRKRYTCICQRFIEHKDFFSLRDVKGDEKHWIESLLKLSSRQRIVSMLDSTATPHAFSVAINKYDETEYVVEFTDISERMMEKLQLEKQLNRDQLTDSYNRVYFETNIQNIMKLNKDKGFRTGIIFFDIDHFKEINDNYGHDVGDEVLVALVGLVKEQIRKVDHLIRWGGEEFIILARTESLESMQSMAENLRRKIENHNFKDIPTLTCSFGLALNEEEESIKTTVTRADEKLYEAKKNGRNQVRV
ncbi:MAG: diguanylate cyclase [Sulfurimonas sp.]|nr:diguanylate cyclase [Sulfurimonas sp.]